MSSKVALVLGGGGARAAYQVGVLKAIVTQYPRHHKIPFDILCGTSAGAINATSLATHAGNFHLSIKKLNHVWGNFKTEQIYISSIMGVIKHLGKMSIKGMQASTINPEAGSLFNNEPLRELLNQVMDFKRVDNHIARGNLTALSIDASCYDNSKSVSFFQATPDIKNWVRARRQGIRTQLYTSHLLASTAIPLVFPSIRLKQKYFGDGSVHQLAPLSSPIHLGAEKILVISLDSEPQTNVHRKKHHPTTATIAGHLLDTIFSDTLNSDLERLQRVNKTIQLLPETHQNEYALRPIETLVIKPSQSLGDIAARYYYHMPFAIRTLLRLLGINHRSDSSLISYLLFEQSYTRALIELGFKDAQQQLDKINAFLKS